MQYRAAAQFYKSSPCTNVPIHCPICPTSVSKAPQTIWKYNALFHLTSEHATDSTPPKIPRQLLAYMHIRKEEEKALNIKEEATDAWREEHNIPGTEILLKLIVRKIVFAISGITNRIRPVQSSTIRPDMANTIFATVISRSAFGRLPAL